MHEHNDETDNGHAAEHRPNALAVRTYPEIARILAARGEPDMTPARTARICRAAEKKIAMYLRHAGYPDDEGGRTL